MSNILQLKISRLLGLSILLTCMFPWSSPIPIKSDTQPIAFLLSILYCTLFVRSINKRLLPAIFMLTGAAFISLSNFNQEAIRGLFGYLSVVFIPAALIHYFSAYGLPQYKFYRNVLITWCLVGTIQFWTPEIVSFLSSRDGVYAFSGGRGSMSFAPEPTFYAIFLTLIGFIILLVKDRSNISSNDRINGLFLIIIFQIIFLSRSSLIIIFLMATFLLFIIIFCKPLKLIFTSITLIILLYLLGRLTEINVELASSSRLIYLLTAISSSEIADILLIDGSISDRAVQILTSHIKAINNYLLPHGFGVWSAEANNLPSFLSGAYNSIEGLNRVLSLLGSMLYEVGIFSLPFIYVLFTYTCKNLPGHNFKSFFFKITVLMMFLVQAIPIALPTISLIFAILIYMEKSIKIHKRSTPREYTLAMKSNQSTLFYAPPYCQEMNLSNSQHNVEKQSRKDSKGGMPQP